MLSNLAAHVPTSSLPRVAVLYDHGSASATEIIGSLRGKVEPVMLLSSSEHAQAQRRLVERLCESHDLPLVTAEALEALRPLRLDGVVTYSERLVEQCASAAEQLGLPGTGMAAAAIMRDKQAQRECFAKAGLEEIRTATAAKRADLMEAIESVGVPCVIKPRQGLESRDTYLVTAEGDVADLPVDAANAPYVVEEYLEGADFHPLGDYVSVDSIVVDGDVIHVAVTGKLPLLPPFRELGQFWPSQLDLELEGQVRRLATDAVKAVGVRNGLTHTEIKLTPKGPRIIEVNGRLGGLLNELAIRAGVDLIAAAALIAAGKHDNALTPTTDALRFQLWMPAPTFPCTLRAVEGAREVLAIPQVTGYYPHVKPGDAIAGGVATKRMGQISGTCKDPGEMLAIIQKINDSIYFTFEHSDGSRSRLSGHDLVSF